MSQLKKIKKAIVGIGKVSNPSLKIRMTEQDRRRVSDKINELQELFYSLAYINKHGMF